MMLSLRSYMWNVEGHQFWEYARTCRPCICHLEPFTETSRFCIGNLKLMGIFDYCSCIWRTWFCPKCFTALDMLLQITFYLTTWTLIASELAALSRTGLCNYSIFRISFAKAVYAHVPPGRTLFLTKMNLPLSKMQWYISDLQQYSLRAGRYEFAMLQGDFLRVARDPNPLRRYIFSTAYAARSHGAEE